MTPDPEFHTAVAEYATRDSADATQLLAQLLEEETHRSVGDTDDAAVRL